MNIRRQIIDNHKSHKTHKNYQEHSKRRKQITKYKRLNIKVKYIKHRINKNK
jgi:hypothetical protein